MRRRRLPPTDAVSRCCRPDGSASSNAPNIDAAIAAKNSASGTITHGLARNEPNALPTSANTVPSVPNITAMPGRRRGVASSNGAAARHALAAEDADGDRNHRVDAGRERREQAAVNANRKALAIPLLAAWANVPACAVVIPSSEIPRPIADWRSVSSSRSLRGQRRRAASR